MSRLAIVFVLLASIAATALACSKNHNFDYILLATQWPETFCESQRCVQHQDKWSIHGAWPENNDGSWPQDCCTEKPFNAALLKPIEAELIAHWKTLKSGSTNDVFWSHEYSKHGTCSVDSPLLKDELAYFNNTLTAFKKLKIDEWLAAAGIVPSASKTYPVEAFHQAIKKGSGVTAAVDCVVHRKKGVPVISQINFCLKKETLQPFDCPLRDHNCKPHVQIGYHPSH